MKHKLMDSGLAKYIKITDPKFKINSLDDVIELIAICGEKGSVFVLLSDAHVNNDFFDLETGFAEKILEKLRQHGIKGAMIINNENIMVGRFKEMAEEENKKNDFRFYDWLNEAEEFFIQSSALF